MCGYIALYHFFQMCSFQVLDTVMLATSSSRTLNPERIARREGTDMKRIACMIASMLAFFVVLSVVVVAQESTQLKGLVTARSADTMTVQTSDGTNHTVVLTDDTKVRMPKGLGLRHKEVAWTSLIPGLAVSVKGTPNGQGQLIATQVDFTKDSLQTASMIQAGLAPTQRQVEVNQQNIVENRQGIESNKQQIAKNEQETSDRFASLADYDVKNEVTVYFSPGSNIISQKDKTALSQLASGALKLQGYLIEVKGFADSTGNAAMNQTLSKSRAEAVINHLLQSCNVPPRHLLAPGAMGISNPVASNESAEGRANNRRVEVRVMVNKGVASSAGN